MFYKTRVRKGVFGVLLCFMAFFMLTACGSNQDGTYYPASGDMKANLEAGGYSVTVSDELDVGSGTHLAANKGEDYIEFYWLDSSADCDYYYELLQQRHAYYNSLVELKNDEKFGTLVYCGTKQAVDTAGIKVVKVKV